jgi:hypothetical protein
MMDAFGRRAAVRTNAYFVPNIQIRLFSPQTYFQFSRDVGAAKSPVGRWLLQQRREHFSNFPYERYSNLPMMLLDPSALQVGAHLADDVAMSHVSTSAHDEMSSLISIVDQTNQQ